MGGDFLGQGWRIPILPDASGGLGWVSGDANVEQSLKILLLTRLGERVMRSDFGTRVPARVFQPGSEQNLRGIEKDIRDAVATWEPRVDILDVVAEADPAEESHLTVSVSYRVRRSNTRNSLVFPFYLPREEPR